ncbi:STAS domain-containing protein [Acinetobacter portensis]|uniref:STAS domain-containing protein n=2 Tax=Acinetobacter TaxID=469 RepID=A0A6L6GCD2_9GAMM|nr:MULTISPECIES: STAS domain-containing protein [Acinetobacter]MBP7783107.1 STAS domain-containing protein [Acinetobacter sp.]MBP7793548.1 STAS domain-containing protein [Acinetobacter sp.]MCK7609251.1 STAS domain-containing protein [Acinetobacter portensis]MCK7640028.1 STAS domain-containing protein [Acinetobacter portensis]MDY6458908.1 STAS domain-containing protein [Acinetobacter faecalis]
MIEFKNQQLVVSGKIDYDNAEEYYQEGLAILQTKIELPAVVDLSQLEHGSTLALAVLVRLLRQTPNSNGLKFKSVPAKMMNIIQACHLESDLQLLD